MKRRQLIQNLAAAPFLLSARNLDLNSDSTNSQSRVQCSVNAYTFNSDLRNGKMDFSDMMEFAAEIGLNAVDLTGYYFPDYPKVPSDKMLFQQKKKALQLGLNIPWTGVRNNFVNPDENSRKADKELINKWLQASSKLGASIMRIFAGKGEHDGYSRDDVKEWMVKDFQECAKYAEENGVVAGMQHHNDFLYEADEVVDILKRVDSEWFGLILDIGSLRKGDPYKEIRKLAPHANYWFIKELVYKDGIAEPVNMKTIATILKEVNYQGYVSFESLTDGDPKQIVTSMFNDFRNAFDKL